MENALEKFQAYVAVQQTGYFNMFDPRARELAEEMSDMNISKSDWVYIMKNYKSLKELV